jgi:Domain of unknown function (DUF4116)
MTRTTLYSIGSTRAAPIIGRNMLEVHWGLAHHGAIQHGHGIIAHGGCRSTDREHDDPHNWNGPVSVHNADKAMFDRSSAVAVDPVDATLAIEKDGRQLRQYPSLQSDYRTVLLAVSGTHGGEALQYASDELKNNRSIVTMAVSSAWGAAIQYASDQLRNDKDIAMTVVVTNNPFCYYTTKPPDYVHLPKSMREDWDIAMAAVSCNSKVFPHLPAKWRNDPTFALAAMSSAKPNLLDVPAAMRNDWSVVMAAVSRSGSNLQYASALFRNDKMIVMAAVTASDDGGRNLRYASSALRDAPFVVTAAVTNHGLALEYASRERQNDFGIVMMAVTKAWQALRFASPSLQGDRSIVMVAVRQPGNDALQWASGALQADHGVVAAAVTNRGRALEYASRELRNDPAIVLMALQQDGRAIEFASSLLRGNKSIVMAAVCQRGGGINALQWASRDLRADAALVVAAAETTGCSPEYVSKTLQKDCEEIIFVVGCFLGLMMILVGVREGLRTSRSR